MKKILLPILGIFAVAATGCGGGSGAGTVSPVAAIGAPTTGYPVNPPPGTTTAPASGASAVFHISVPNASGAATASNSRKPEYISTGTQSVTVAVTSLNGSAYSATAPVTANLTRGSSNCVAGSGDTNVVCSVTFPSLPVGTDGFTATTFSGLMGAGQALSTNKTTGIISVATVTNVPLTLNGIIGSLLVNVGAPSLVPGTPSTHGVTITANDASGAQIIGSAPFSTAVAGVANPILVTTDDTLSAIGGLTTLTNAGQLESFTYTGAGILATEHIIATSTTGGFTASGLIPVTAAAMTLNVVGTPIDASPLTFTGAGPYAVSTGTDSVLVVKAVQAGWGVAAGNAFTVTNTCGANVVVTNTATDTFTLTSGVGAKTCSVTINGGTSVSSVMNITQQNGNNGANVQLQSTTKKS